MKLAKSSPTSILFLLLTLALLSLSAKAQALKLELGFYPKQSPIIS
jgi:hypothetical protein